MTGPRVGRSSVGRTRRSHGSTGRWRLGPSPARAAALLAIVACVLALYGLMTVPALAIERIDVSPLTWTSHDEVLQRLRVDLGTNAFRFSTDQLVERLEALPTVAGATVEVHLPDTLAVGVTERTPILTWTVRDLTFLVDRDGMLFTVVGRIAGSTAGLPTIVDERGASVALGIGSRLDATDFDAATRLASLTPADLGTGATGLMVRITDADGFVLTTTPASWTAVFGPYSPILRSPALIPGQVRLLRSLLFGQERQIDRVVLADETHGTVVPLASGR